MQLLRVFPVLGAILMVFALTLLVPLAVSVAMNDGAQAVWLPSLGLTLVCGALLRLAVFKVGARVELQTRDGMLLVSLVWTMLPLFAAVPLLLHFSAAGQPISFTDAYFEAMSGLTTTGAAATTGAALTILADEDHGSAPFASLPAILRFVARP